MDSSVSHTLSPDLILSVNGSAGQDEIGHFFDACASILRGVLKERGENRSYSANLTGAQLGPLVMSRVLMTGGQYHYHRDARLIATSGLDLIFVQVILEGSDTRLVNGEEVVSRPGDIFIADLTRAMRTMTTHCGNFSFVLPRSAFGLRDIEFDRLHDQHIPANSLASRLIVNHLNALWTDRHMIGHDEIPGLAGATAGLIASFVPSIQSRIDFDGPTGSRHLQICQYIEMNLSDLSLGPDELARRFNLSRAALYRLFSDTDGVANYIRERRLRQAFRKLVGTEQPRVSAVGFASGFASTSTFIRAFRSKYGLTPGEAIESASLRLHPQGDDMRSAEGSVLRSWIERADRGGRTG